MTKAHILSKKLQYDGFVQIYAYDLKVGSLEPTQNPERRIQREVIHCSDAVSVLIFAPEIDSFVLCREFRVGVFLNQAQDDPYILQAVAGMVDKDKKPEEIALMEIKEEAGLEAGELTHIATAYTSPGRMTEKTYCYYTEVKGIPQNGLHGLPEEHEEIATCVLKREAVYKMMDELKIRDSMTLLALNWFRANKKL